MGELRDRMEADLRLRGYAEKTRVAYVSCVRAFARHFRRSGRMPHKGLKWTEEVGGFPEPSDAGDLEVIERVRAAHSGSPRCR